MFNFFLVFLYFKFFCFQNEKNFLLNQVFNENWTRYGKNLALLAYATTVNVSTFGEMNSNEDVVNFIDAQEYVSFLAKNKTFFATHQHFFRSRAPTTLLYVLLLIQQKLTLIMRALTWFYLLAVSKNRQIRDVIRLQE